MPKYKATLVYAMSQPLRDVPDRFLRRRDRCDVLTAGKAAGVDRAGDLIDVIADGGKLAAYFSVFVGWPWPHFFTGDQCAKIDLHGETGNCHLLLQMPVFRFVQTEKNRDRSFSDNRFLLEIGWGLRGLAPLTSAFG